MAIERMLESKPIIANVFEAYQIKIIFGTVLAILFDIEKLPVIIAIMSLVIFDFLTAVGAVKYTGGQIKSAKIFRTVVKLLTYLGVVSAGFMLEKVIGFNVGADDLLIVFLGATEFISIMENMAKLGFNTPKKLLNIVEDIRDNAGNSKK